MFNRYKLIHRDTNAVVTYGDDNTVIFGGLWGECDDDGKPYYIWVDNTPSLGSLRVAKLQEIDRWTAAAITGGFISAATGEQHQYDSDVNDQQNLILMLQAALSADFETHPIYQGHIPIRAIPAGQNDKVVLQHSAAQMQSVVNDMAMHIGTCKTLGWQLQGTVALAETPEALEAITWPS